MPNHVVRSIPRIKGPVNDFLFSSGDGVTLPNPVKVS
jgi:hypothetical protein